jgi:DNA-binding MltR family transcriptional regulator
MFDIMNQQRKFDPEVEQLAKFLAAFDKESDRGAALVAASMLDERLEQILSAFFIESAAAKDLVSGFNAPLGTFSSRALAAASLGLIQENEFKEITIIRKIRNEFGHGWEPLSFETDSISAYARKLPWRGPSEFEESASNRSRFNAAVALLLGDLMWRVRLVSSERCASRIWPQKMRE